MGQIEREIKILNVDVNHIKSTLKKKGIEPKGKFIQDVYTFDLPTVDELYAKYVEIFLKNNDIRGLKKLILEIRPCFDKDDINLIEKNLGTKDILDFINDDKNDFNKLKSDEIYELMKKTNENFSKWVRLRQTGDETTITIKRIVNSKGEYELDAVNELEFDVPSIRLTTARPYRQPIERFRCNFRNRQGSWDPEKWQSPLTYPFATYPEPMQHPHHRCAR